MGDRLVLEGTVASEDEKQKAELVARAIWRTYMASP